MSRAPEDLLTEAAEALRLETSCDEDSGKFMRARVLASLHQTKVRRRTRLAFVLPLAASFVAATAWGTVSGRTQALASNVARVLGFTIESAAPPPPKVPVRRKTKPTAPLPSVSPPVIQPPEPVLEAPPLNPPPAPIPSARGSARPEADPTHLLYRAAHRAHFVDHDWERAVTAWSAYLRAAPNGRFAPEAQYNRALCWVRLGEREAARKALVPFARGQYGTYRQREAQALMDALEPSWR